MSLELTDSSSLPRNHKLFLWFFLVILITALYWNILFKWGQNLWNDPNYSHGILIPFISVYLIYTKSKVLNSLIDRPTNFGMLVILFAIALYLTGYAASEYFTKRISLIFLLFGIVLFLEGWKTFKTLFLPLFLLFFAVPIPYILYNTIAFPLKLVASKIAVAILNLTGLPVFREGNIISLPHTTLEVVDACSGIRSLMTLLTLAFLLATFQHKKIWKQLIVFSLAVPIAVLANAIRVSVTGFMTSFDSAWGEGTLHDLTGWFIFALSFGLLILFSTLLKPKR